MPLGRPSKNACIRAMLRSKASSSTQRAGVGNSVRRMSNGILWGSRRPVSTESRTGTGEPMAVRESGSTSELVMAVADDLRLLLRKEIELARIELLDGVKA